MDSSSIKRGDVTNRAFSEYFFAGKLSKLNGSKRNIETLSRWCIAYHKRAKRLVEMWQEAFESAPQERQVSLLYLVTEIMRTSRCKGDEFLFEFWKVIPSVLLCVFVSYDDKCKKEASRLIGIWSEKKYFVSKGQNLLDEFLGKKASPGHMKVLKRDANCLRINLAVGGLPEKILTAFHVAIDRTANEEAVLEECRSAVSYVQGKEKHGNLLGSDAVSEKQNQANMLGQSICQLGYIESARVALISQLREALQDQESKLKVIQSELTTALHLYVHIITDPRFSPAQGTNSPTPAPPTHPLTTTVDPSNEKKRAIAASLAAKLTASTSPLLSDEAELRRKRPKLDKPPLPQQSQPQPQVPPGHGVGFNGQGPQPPAPPVNHQ